VSLTVASGSGTAIAVNPIVDAHINASTPLGYAVETLTISLVTYSGTPSITETFQVRVDKCVLTSFGPSTPIGNKTWAVAASANADYYITFPTYT
jgi:hypothetical protein